MAIRKKYSRQEALGKLMKYCAYQERCHSEVEQKLYDWGFFDEEERGNIIIKLIDENFLNEERFARAFVRGKFKIKKWGRLKITFELRQKKITENLIKIALNEIEEDLYANTLKEVIDKKSRLLQESDPFIKNKKIAQYAIFKGFEPDLVWNFLR